MTTICVGFIALSFNISLVLFEDEESKRLHVWSKMYDFVKLRLHNTRLPPNLLMIPNPFLVRPIT